jgi:type I restriction enzyme, R subunit
MRGLFFWIIYDRIACSCNSLEAHTTMSSQALVSDRVRDGLKDILLGPAQLYGALRARA